MSIIYYRPGAGECAAAIALKAGVDEARMVGYGQPFPSWMTRSETSYLVGIVPKAFEMEELCEHCDVIFIDHRDDNIDAMKESIKLKQLKVQMVTDTETPMSVLTWKHFFPDDPVPECVSLYGRYKIWDLDDRVQIFNTGCRLLKTNKISTWTSFLNNENDIFETTMARGVAMQRYYDMVDDYAANHMVFETEMDDVRVYAANTRAVSSTVFDRILKDGPNGPQHGILYQYDVRRKAYSLTIYDLVDSPKVSSAEMAKKHGGGAGSSSVANFHALFGKLPFEQRPGCPELNGEPDFLDIKNIEDKVLEDEPIMEQAIDHEHSMDTYKQQLVDMNNGDKAVVANLMHLEWSVDHRIIETAKWKIAWCWVAQDGEPNNGCYRLLVQSLVPGKDAEKPIQYVKELPFNPMQ